MNKSMRNRYIAIAAAVALALIFLMQNNRPVEIEFFFWTLANTNMLLLLLIFFALGGVVGFFGNQIYRAKKKSRQYKKQLDRERKQTRGGYHPEGTRV